MNGPKSGTRAIPRLMPNEPFPPYSYVPGQSPHPISDPRGHSYGKEIEPPELPAPEKWRGCPVYLYGLDLFNHGYYWEAHEAWESLWHVSGRKGTAADFLKALIKLAAAGVKHRAKQPAGVRSHACRAAKLWRQIATSSKDKDYFGFRLADLIALADSICQDGWPENAPLLVPKG